MDARIEGRVAAHRRVHRERAGDDAGREHLLGGEQAEQGQGCLLYTSPSPRDGLLSRMPSSA